LSESAGRNVTRARSHPPAEESSQLSSHVRDQRRTA